MSAALAALASRRILLGICGGIAAYKAPYLVRRLREQGAQVRCILTPHARRFVAPLTLEVLSAHAVLGEEYLEPNGSGEELHLTTAHWAEALCIAPCTAHTLARLALGLADDFLATTALAFDGPLIVAPAMHEAMWVRASTQEHVDTLRRRGVVVVGPASGALASGEVGVGRMVEPEELVAALVTLLGRGPLRGLTVLINAGPTREPLDPVRFLSNRSSGRMGFALAEEAARRGARVVLVAGPVELPTPPGVERRDVETAEEMRHEVYRVAPEADLVILSAAVADFRPAQRQPQKIKKDKDPRSGLELRLERTPDVLAGLGEVAPRALRVGFAAETERLEEHAREKLSRKGVHYLVANDVSRHDIGFGSDSNEVTVYGADGSERHLERRPKREIARLLLELFTEALAARAATAARPAAGRGGHPTAGAS